MGAGTPPGGSESSEVGGHSARVVCPRCGDVIVFVGRMPRFCSSCGNPLSQLAEESTVTPGSGPAEAPTLPRFATGDLPAEGEPEVIGGYSLLRRIGGGGMGAVYEAVDPASGHHVALKLLGGGQELSADAVERFRREGRLASALSHPHCVFVLAVDEDAGRPYIVMELMPGHTLADLVRARGPLPPAEAVGKILDVLEGLQEIHGRGVVHRDIKPSNCFLDRDGRVKLGDFGLSKSLVGDVRLTRTGSFLGTPLFASPEQLRSEPVGPASDLYSLSATLYCLLTGRAPFEGGDAAATVARIACDPAPPLRSLRPELPASLERVVLRGLERDPHRRWRNLDEFRDALLEFLPASSVAAGPGLRFAAYAADTLALFVAAMLVNRLLAFLIGAKAIEIWMEPRWSLRILLLGAGALLSLLYFVLPERLWGCTPGKRLLHLRVCALAGREPPGLGRVLVRYGVYYFLTNLSTVLVLPWLFSLEALEASTRLPAQREQQIAVSMLLLASPLLYVFGIGLLFSTMRGRNGWRGLHEFASGTRVIQLPEPAQQARLGICPIGDDLARLLDLPQQIGPFEIRGALRWDQENRVLVGEDHLLGRSVLLWLRPATAAPLSPTRRACARSTRLRWLATGEQDGWRWDAFPAPACQELADVVQQQGPLSWTQTRPILEQLVDELIQANGEGTLPDTLSVEQVWLKPGGGMLLLDVPYRRSAGDSSGAVAQRVLALAGQTALVALEGRLRPGARRVRAPLPLHAIPLLGRLLSETKPYRDVEEFRVNLEVTREKPTEVSRFRRTFHVATLAIFLFFSMSVCVAPALLGVLGPTGYMTMFIRLAQLKSGREQLHSLEAADVADHFALVLSPQPLARLAVLYSDPADAQLRERLRTRLEKCDRELQGRRNGASFLNRGFFDFLDQAIKQVEAQAEKADDAERGAKKATQPDRRDVDTFSRSIDFTSGMESFLSMAALVLLLLWFVSILFFAAFLHGGLSYHILGLALVRADGQSAGWWRCAGRALLTWAPPTLLAAAVILLEYWHWLVIVPESRLAWVPWLVDGLRWTTLALLVAYAILAIRFPRRSVNDWLAGTYVVPY